MNRYQKACYKMAKDRVKEDDFLYPDIALQYFYKFAKLLNKPIPLKFVLEMAYEKKIKQ